MIGSEGDSDDSRPATVDDGENALPSPGRETDERLLAPGESPSGAEEGGERTDDAEAGKGDEGDERPTPRRHLRRALVWTVVALLVAPILVALWWLATWPDVAALAEEPPQTTAFIERARGRGEEIRWHWVPDHRIAPALRRAVVAAEDMSFFSHTGFDTHEMEKALQEALSGGRVRGASTITQQLAKNLWLSPSRNPLRKLREALLTRSLEKHLSKRRILEIYLNVAEFGPSVFGAEAAARRYFGKSAAALTAPEAARLAASLPSSRWVPGSGSRAYRAHLARVEARAAEADWLDRLVR